MKGMFASPLSDFSYERAHAFGSRSPADPPHSDKMMQRQMQVVGKLSTAFGTMSATLDQLCSKVDRATVCRDRLHKVADDQSSLSKRITNITQELDEVGAELEKWDFHESTKSSRREQRRHYASVPGPDRRRQHKDQVSPILRTPVAGRQKRRLSSLTSDSHNLLDTSSQKSSIWLSDNGQPRNGGIRKNTPVRRRSKHQSSRSPAISPPQQESSRPLDLEPRRKSSGKHGPLLSRRTQVKLDEADAAIDEFLKMDFKFADGLERAQKKSARPAPNPIPRRRPPPVVVEPVAQGPGPQGKSIVNLRAVRSTLQSPPPQKSPTSPAAERTSVSPQAGTEHSPRPQQTTRSPREHHAVTRTKGQKRTSGTPSVSASDSSYRTSGSLDSRSSKLPARRYLERLRNKTGGEADKTPWQRSIELAIDRRDLEEIFEELETDVNDYLKNIIEEFMYDGTQDEVKWMQQYVASEGHLLRKLKQEYLAPTKGQNLANSAIKDEFSQYLPKEAWDEDYLIQYRKQKMILSSRMFKRWKCRHPPRGNYSKVAERKGQTTTDEQMAIAEEEFRHACRTKKKHFRHFSKMAARMNRRSTNKRKQTGSYANELAAEERARQWRMRKQRDEVNEMRRSRSSFYKDDFNF